LETNDEYRVKVTLTSLRVLVANSSRFRELEVSQRFPLRPVSSATRERNFTLKRSQTSLPTLKGR